MKEPAKGKGLGKGLGRGLAALLGDEAPPPAAGPAAEAPAEAAALRREADTLPIEFLRPGRFQPRTAFDPEQLAALAQSLREKGMLQPILVRPLPEPDRYEIVAGERRWRAAQQAQLHEIPVIVRKLDDRDTLEIALIENLQRQDLNAIEEAEGFRRLRDEFGLTQEALAQALGKSRSHIANTLRLLDLPEPVRKLLAEGALTAGHARAIATAPDAAALAARIVRDGLSVRQAEKLAQGTRPAGAAKAPSAAGGWDGRGTVPVEAFTDAKSPDAKAVARDLEQKLGLRVELKVGKGERTALVLYCDDFEQLDDIVARLGRSPAWRQD